MFDIISVVVLCETEEEEWRRPDPKIFLCIPASAADATAVNPRGIKMLLANGLITFFVNGNPVLVMDQVIYQGIFLIVSS